MVRARVSLGMCLVWGACSSSQPAGQRAPEPRPPAAAPSEPAASAPKPAAPVETPPAVHLQWLEAHGAHGLAIQNRSERVQRIAAELRLVAGGATRALRLTDDRPCLPLRPGGEWLWPPDWGQTLAPDQAWLAGLEGEMHFEVWGCDGGQPVRSAARALPEVDP